jgi:hypothetical protein
VGRLGAGIHDLTRVVTTGVAGAADGLIRTLAENQS